MKHESFWRTLTAGDRRVVRNWTWGVLIVYGTIALTVFGLASLMWWTAPAPSNEVP